MIAVLAMPAGYMYYELARPITVPKTDVPSPNGHEQLVAVGHQLAVPGITPARRDELLQEARQHLAMPSLVDVDYFKPAEYEHLTPLRELGRKLVAAGEAEQLAGEFSGALSFFSDTLTLAERSQRGGLLIDSLVGSAIEGLAVGKLTSLAPDLSADQCRATAQRLLIYDDTRDSIEAFLDRDKLYTLLAYGWGGRWNQTVSKVSGSRQWVIMDATVRHTRCRDQARLRVLVCDLAVRAHTLNRRTLPASLDELVPEYLSAVPLDPFDGRPVKFVQGEGQYSLSCVEGGPGAISPYVLVRPAGGERSSGPGNKQGP